MDIKIRNVSKGPYAFNAECLKSQKNVELTYNIASHLRYSKKHDYVGFQLDILVIHDDRQIYKSGFMIGMEISGWSDDLNKNTNLDENRNRIIDIYKAGWFVATGIVSMQTTVDDFDGMVLPTFDYEKLAAEVILMPQKDEEK